jgi:hypothetical protein
MSTPTNSRDRITFGQWFRTYHKENFTVTDEEVAWGVMERKGWPATPELLANLIEVIRDQRINSDTTGK